MRCWRCFEDVGRCNCTQDELRGAAKVAVVSPCDPAAGRHSGACYQSMHERGKALCAGQARTPTGSGDFSIGGDLWPGLSKLIEEAGEVIQVAGKLMGSEGRTDHWSGDLRKMLVEELGDLQAAIAFFVVTNGLDDEAIDDRMTRKLITFKQWHRNGQGARRQG